MNLVVFWLAMVVVDAVGAYVGWHIGAWLYRLFTN